MDWSTFVLAGVGVLSFFGSVLIQYSGRSEWYGAVSTRLDSHDKSIEKIEAISQRQWNVIGEHGNEIAALKVGVRKPNGHHGSL